MQEILLAADDTPGARDAAERDALSSTVPEMLHGIERDVRPCPSQACFAMNGDASLCVTWTKGGEAPLRVRVYIGSRHQLFKWKT